MKYLPKDFKLDKYGLHVRFVTVDDAEFILNIRTNQKNERFIHDTYNDLDLQKEYIKKYKDKETVGEEYYFIFELKGIPQGVYRIYNRTEEWCTTGSWVFDVNCDKTAALKALIITHEIVFNELGYDVMKDVDGINEHNLGVINAVKSIGAAFDGTRMEKKGVYLPFEISKTNFIKNRARILRYVGIRI